MGKQADGSHLTSQEGVHAVGLVVTRDLGWIFRDQPVSDYGIDAHLELVSNNSPSGKLLGLQIKAGESYLSEQTATGYVYRGQNRHLAYWQNHSLPVVIVLYDPVAGVCYWQAVRDEDIEHTKTGWKIVVPKDQILSAESRDALVDLIDGSPFQQGLRRLFLHKPWMEHIQRGHKVVLEAERWVNKSLTRTTPRIAVLVDDDDDNELLSLSWSTVYVPGLYFVEALMALFPWAEISIDDDFYERYADENDDATARRHHADEDYWPYDEDGEVANYRFVLKLNELGLAFLTLEAHLTAMELPYTFTIDDLKMPV